MKIRRGACVAASVVALGCAGTTSPPPPATAEDPAAEVELPRAEPGVLEWLGATMAVPLWQLELDEAEAREVAAGVIQGARRGGYSEALTVERREQITDFLSERAHVVSLAEQQAGRAVLEAAASAPGAVRRESGLVVTELEAGEGPTPSAEDTILVHYHGTLRDGSVFSTTREREPRRFELISAVRCWKEALADAAVGARLHLVCPPALGYGLQGLPPAVPGGAVLIFELELLEVVPQG